MNPNSGNQISPKVRFPAWCKARDAR